MKLRIMRVALANALAHVLKAVSTRTPLPALTGIKLLADRTGLTFTATNLTIAICVHIPTLNPKGEKQVFVAESGEVLLPGKIFTEIIRKLGEDELELTTSDLHHVQIKSGSAKFQINGMDPSRFPELPAIDLGDNSNNKSFSIPRNDLKKLIRKTCFAASLEEKDNVMSGVLWAAGDNFIECTATDTRRLSRQKIDLSTDKNFRSILPSKSLSELMKTFADYQGDIQITLLDNQMLFSGDNILFYTRLLQGIYPDVSNAIPKACKTKVHVNASTLLYAVDKAYLISRDDEENNIIKLTIQDDSLLLSSVSKKLGSFSDTIPATRLEGSDLTISLNTEYLLESLNVIDSESVELKFNDYVSPCIVKAVGDDSSIQLIVPILTH